MFDTIKKYLADFQLFTDFDPNGVYIRQMKNGRWRLLKNGNEVVSTYNRKAGAVQGAKRRGLTITGISS